MQKVLADAIYTSRMREDYVQDSQARRAAAREYEAGLEAAGAEHALREARLDWQAGRPRRFGEVHQAGVMTEAQRKALDRIHWALRDAPAAGETSSPVLTSLGEEMVRRVSPRG